MARQLHNTMCDNTCFWRTFVCLGATSHVSYFLVSVCLGVTAVFEKFILDVTDKTLNLNFEIFDTLRNGILVQNMTFMFEIFLNDTFYVR